MIVDGADNFPSRYLLNDASVKLGIPVVHGSIFRFEGMVSVFDPKNGPDLPRHGARAAAGRAGPRAAPRPACSACCPASSARIQALETIKVLLGLGEPLIGRILSIDTTDMSFRTFNLKRDPRNEVTWDNRDRIVIHELEGLCAPGLSH